MYEKRGVELFVSALCVLRLLCGKDDICSKLFEEERVLFMWCQVKIMFCFFIYLRESELPSTGSLPECSQ